MNTDTTERQPKRTRRYSPGRPKNKPRPPGPPKLNLTAEQKRVAYAKYAEHQTVCLKLGIEPTCFDIWARDYTKATVEQLSSARWTAQNRGEGFCRQRYHVYEAGCEGGMRDEVLFDVRRYRDDGPGA